MEENLQREQESIKQQLLRVSKAARILDVSLSQAYNLINRGELPAIRIGRSIRIPLHPLNAYLLRKAEEGLR